MNPTVCTLSQDRKNAGCCAENKDTHCSSAAVLIDTCHQPAGVGMKGRNEEQNSEKAAVICVSWVGTCSLAQI